MTCPPPQGADIYELRVHGHLDQHWSGWFGDFTITHNRDGTSTLRGSVTDQSQLHGVLTKVRDLAVGLISVTPAEQVASPAPRESDAPGRRAPDPRQDRSPAARPHDPDAEGG